MSAYVVPSGSFTQIFRCGYSVTIFTSSVMQVVDCTLEKITFMDRMFIVSCDLCRSEKIFLFLSLKSTYTAVNF